MAISYDPDGTKFFPQWQCVVLGSGLWYAHAMIARDILFITLALAALVATAFWVALMWYVIKILRSFKTLIEEFQHRLATIDDILRTIKDKLTSTHLELSLVSEGLKQLIQFVMNRRSKRRSGTRASSAADDI